MPTGERVMVAWPLSDEQRAHVSRMAELVRRFGAGRFLHAHVVRADQRDFPDPWEPTLASLYRLMYRLFWHAHLDAEIEIDDLRGGEGRAMLRSSGIDFIEAKDGRAEFQVVTLGNDDIAGFTSHLVGEAFLALSPAAEDPFRPAASADADATEASLAACYLGLGVLVANSSMYRRYQSRLVGRDVLSEQRIERAGGLAIGDATLILAIQLTVRDDVPGAVETLHGPQKEWLDRWLAVLDPHEDELREMLGLDGADQSLPARSPEPRTPSKAIVEPARPVRNEGLESFRVTKRRRHFWLGLGAGLAGFGVAVVIAANTKAFDGSFALIPIPLGAILGFFITRQGFQCFACKKVVGRELPTCPSCRVTLKETLDAQGVKARIAEWAKAAEEDDAETAAEAEAAYHPDV
jgi:hypothetical protein